MATARRTRRDGVEETTMPITLSPLTPGFACEVGDVDLTRPLDDADLAAVRDAFARFAVLVFPSQDLTVEQHLAFARCFGTLERSVATVMPGETLRVSPEIADIANLTSDGRVWAKDHRLRLFQMGNRLWHTDSSFKQPTGCASLLYARSIAPIGGHTEFADLRAAWDALDEATRARADGLIAEHSLQFSRRRLGFADWSPQERVAFAPVARPLVRTIPESGRRSLYLASHIGRVRGLADDEAEALLARLVAHATERRFTYLHRWRVGDLVMWDNRCTMHRGTEFDDTRWPRDMQRATTSDVPDAFDDALRAAGYGTAAEDAARSTEAARAEAARAAA
ncbi:MAG: TauD/TfdA family dioxygenase [Burkholderiales bacterium]|nr:TauD/TfdA family dioxygenase [Burkholderiales bacterium]